MVDAAITAKENAIKELFRPMWAEYGWDDSILPKVSFRDEGLSREKTVIDIEVPKIRISGQGVRQNDTAVNLAEIFLRLIHSKIDNSHEPETERRDSQSRNASVTWERTHSEVLSIGQRGYDEVKLTVDSEALGDADGRILATAIDMAISEMQQSQLSGRDSQTAGVGEGESVRREAGATRA